MSFMEPDIVYGRWYLHEDGGEEFWADEDCTGLGHRLIEKRDGWGSRLSASGFMDCTEWTVHDSEDEAREDLALLYDLCPRCLAEDCDCDDAAQRLREIVDNG